MGGVKFGNDGASNIFRPTRPLFRLAPAPAFEISIHVRRPILHRIGIDRGLEAVGQQPLHLSMFIPGLDVRRDVLPEHHLVLGHHAASTSSARRVSSSPNPTCLTSSGRLRYSPISCAFATNRVSANCARYKRSV